MFSPRLSVKSVVYYKSTQPNGEAFSQGQTIYSADDTASAPQTADNPDVRKVVLVD
jgi:hypothetical protein